MRTVHHLLRRALELVRPPRAIKAGARRVGAIARALLEAGPAGGPGGPGELVRSAIERAVGVCDRTETDRVARGLFDFAEIAARCLAGHWTDRTAGEREEFVRLLTGLLGRAYFGKLRAVERIVSAGEAVRGRFATVRCTLVTTQGTEIPLEHRLRRSGRGWRVHDFAIDGVSFVGTYRERLHGIIETSSYQDLVWRMQLKSFDPASGVAA